jgi:hypothetical protein
MNESVVRGTLHVDRVRRFPDIAGGALEASEQTVAQSTR